MTQDAFGPDTRLLGGTKWISPSSFLSLGFVSCSNSIKASHTAGLAETRSNKFIGGNRDAIIRQARGHATRRAESL
jgi:hypothetical protein